jgi:hypothetical protein
MRSRKVLYDRVVVVVVVVMMAGGYSARFEPCLALWS